MKLDSLVVENMVAGGCWRETMNQLRRTLEQRCRITGTMGAVSTVDGCSGSSEAGMLGFSMSGAGTH